MTKREYFNALVSHLPKSLQTEIGAPKEMGPDKKGIYNPNESTI